MAHTMLNQLRLVFVFGLLAAIGIAPLAARTRVAGASETISISVHEGTTLSFDISPDGRWIAMDLLGQLWLVPAAGGTARAITDAVRDVAEDQDPSFSPGWRQARAAAASGSLRQRWTGASGYPRLDTRNRSNI